uniref:Acetyl-CoA hydrolase n=1 Tax=Meloidogyne javanica TaxID=6303 RepID=A0A915MXA1_MELJA
MVSSLFHYWKRCPTQCRYLSGLRHFDKPLRTLATPIEGKMPKICGLDEAVKEIKSGESIYLHHAVSMPIDLCKALGRHVLKNGLTDIKVVHAMTCGELPWLKEEFNGKIRSLADYIPLFLSNSARLFDEKAIPVDTALLNLSPPDKHGFCSLGVNVDLSSPAARNAKKIIATINNSQPKTFGDSEIHLSQIDYLIEHSINTTPIFELPAIESNDQERLIGKWIAENLVDNGATLQMGEEIEEGAGVVTTKGHCNYVVTEYGIASLWGKTVRQRAYELIQISHPDDREMLEKEAFKRFGFIPTKED